MSDANLLIYKQKSLKEQYNIYYYYYDYYCYNYL